MWKRGLEIVSGFIIAVIFVLLLFTVLFEMAPFLPNSTNGVLNAVHITHQQYALDERITKDALVLTQDGDHSQAILELQVSLPVFEKNQAGLQKNNDPSLGLPAHIPGDVQLMIIQSQSDYAALDSAARSILKNADQPIDPNQLTIIRQHERPYFLTMNNASAVWQGHIIDTAMNFFRWELGFGLGMLALVIVHWILGKVIKVLQKKEDIKEQEKANETAITQNKEHQ
jgi:hypothetical protein